MTRAEYARLAADQMANTYDDKLDHLQDAIEALRAYTGEEWRVEKKLAALAQRLRRLKEERHVAVKTAYDLAWGQYPAYRFQEARIAELSAQVSS